MSQTNLFPAEHPTTTATVLVAGLAAFTSLVTGFVLMLT